MLELGKFYLYGDILLRVTERISNRFVKISYVSTSHLVNRAQTRNVALESNFARSAAEFNINHHIANGATIDRVFELNFSLLRSVPVYWETDSSIPCSEVAVARGTSRIGGESFNYCYSTTFEIPTRKKKNSKNKSHPLTNIFK